jgi:MFS family permease
MQCVLSPIIGRLSDLLDRKYLAAIPPLIAAAGAITSAKATSMNVLIGGGILNGVALATLAINHSIPSEVLPMKYRVLANGLSYVSGGLGIM